METTPQTVRETLVKLRELPPIPLERRLAALEKFWQRVPLAPPPETGPFPWAQVRRGVEALARSAPLCSEPRNLEEPGVLALILAGNTPLLAWPVLHYCVLLGIPVFIKQSRDETIWTRHFVEILTEIDPEVAALLHLDIFPGDDPRTHTLVQCADAVIAYGSDAAIAALQKTTPAATPFQGFGHAISIGFGRMAQLAHLFAEPVLMYDQAGCLSLQVLYVISEDCLRLGQALAEGLRRKSSRLGVVGRASLSECHIVREARDLALMEGCTLIGDPDLLWSVVIHSEPCPIPHLTGLCTVHLIPWDTQRSLQWYLGGYAGKISCVGGIPDGGAEMREALTTEGVSRICPPSQMQTPPLDWRNGGVDLRAWLIGALEVS